MTLKSELIKLSSENRTEQQEKYEQLVRESLHGAAVVAAKRGEYSFNTFDHCIDVEIVDKWVNDNGLVCRQTITNGYESRIISWSE